DGGGEMRGGGQGPGAQSRGQAVVLAQGAAVIFPSRHRPVAGGRGHYRATVRHGVSRIRSGERMSLGIIFHNAEGSVWRRYGWPPSGWRRNGTERRSRRSTGRT